MLFLVFLGVNVSRDALQRSHITLLIVNLVMGAAGYGLGWIVGGRDVALAGFFAAITPTATMAAVITGFLGGKVEYVVTAFLVTNLVVSMLLPLLMPIALGHATPSAFHDIALSVGVLVFAPLAVALILRRAWPASILWPGRLKNISFGAWVLVLFLIMANTSYFLRTTTTETPLVLIVKIGVVSALICAANFALGHLLGGSRYKREASQSLGQKNTTLTVYLAMTYANPLIALGPTFYVIWHNVWNSWQLQQHARKNDKSETTTPK